MQINKKIAIVLPALDPDDEMTTFVGKLQETLGDKLELVIINDGSKPEKKTAYFDHFEKLSCCTVLHHEVNLGKGAALKNAFRYLLDKYRNDDDFVGCVTADCDGQHSVSDVVKCMELLQANPDKLILGCREFQKDNVPWKSRFGNELTLFIFNKLLRIKVDDTQTGLRGLGRNVMKYSLTIKGNRFEFETDMLLISKIRKFEILSYTIETIYFAANAGTHFRPIKDGLQIYWRIFRILFWQFFKFALSSLSAAILDIGLFAIFFHAIFKEDSILQLTDNLSINSRVLWSCLIARAISSVWNFIANRRLVFRSQGSGKTALIKELLKYYCLVIAVFVISYLLTDLMDNFVEERYLTYIKAAIDTIIFILIFYIQKIFIFKKRSRNTK